MTSIADNNERNTESVEHENFEVPLSSNTSKLLPLWEINFVIKLN